MHLTGKKKEREKKERKKNGYEKFASKGFEPGPYEIAKAVNQRLSPLDHHRNHYSETCLKEVYFPSLW